MAKTESTFKNMVLSLTLISMGASAQNPFGRISRNVGGILLRRRPEVELDIRNQSRQNKKSESAKGRTSAHNPSP